MRKLLLVILITTFGIVATNAQESAKKSERRQQRAIELSQPWKIQYIIGANVACEGNFNTKVWDGGPADKAAARFNPGVSFAVRLTRHSGVEIGVNYRVDKSTYGGWDRPLEPREWLSGYTVDRYISIPVVYKYYSRILNFVAGVNYDIMTGSSRGMARYDHSDRNVFGLVVGVSKDIRLCKGLSIEPYFNLNPTKLWTDNKLWVSGGFGLKYVL